MRIRGEDDLSVGLLAIYSPLFCFVSLSPSFGIASFSVTYCAGSFDPTGLLSA